MQIVIVGAGVFVSGAKSGFLALKSMMQPFMLFQTFNQLFEFFVMLFQQIQTLAQFPNGGVLRVYAVDDIVHDRAMQFIYAFAVAPDNPARNPYDGAVRRNIFVDYRVCADLAVIADGDGAENF